jgi:hypothetical protein
MANQLSKIEPLKLPDLARPDRMPSLPAWVGSRIESVREVMQKDASGKHRMMAVLPQGMTLGSSERKQLEAHAGALRKTLDYTPDNSAEAEAEMLVIVTKMMLAKPGMRASEAGTEATGEAYQIALGDLPPWSVTAALRRWYRRDAPPVDKTPHDYRWRPSEGTLRAIAFEEANKVRGRAIELERLLGAVPMIEFAPETRNTMIDKLSAIMPAMKFERPDAERTEARMRKAEALGRQADKLAAEQNA